MGAGPLLPVREEQICAAVPSSALNDGGNELDAGRAAGGKGRDEDCTLGDIANEVSSHLSITFVVFSNTSTQCFPVRLLLRIWQNL